MIERSITGVFDINFLKECNTPIFFGSNSLGFKLPKIKSESVYLKLSKIPEGFSLIKSQDQLRKICSFRSELVIPFLDICLLEKLFIFQDITLILQLSIHLRQSDPSGILKDFLLLIKI